MMKSRKINTPALMMRAMFEPSTLNDEERTVEVTFATDALVLMRDWDGKFYEELSFDPKHIRLDRLNAGAPLLNNHDRWAGVSGVLGSVQKAWVDGNQGRALIKFSAREEVQPVIQDVKDGILRTISAGYRVYKYEKKGTAWDPRIGKKPDEIPTYRAVDWEPYEISLAPIPADIKATVRSGGSELTNECIIFETETEMNRNEVIAELKQRKIQFDESATDEQLNTLLEQSRSQNPTPAPADPQTPVNADEQIRAAIAAERQRTADITLAVRAARLDDDFAQKMINDGTTIEKARELIIAEFSKQDPNTQTRNGLNIKVTADGDVKTRNAVEAALLLRADEKAFAIDTQTVEGRNLASRAREFRADSLLDIARNMLEDKGDRVRGLSKDEIVTRALSTTDYPLLLGSVVNRILRRAYEAPAQTWRPLSRQMNASDFRTMTAIQAGGNIKLEEVSEGGEFKSGKMAEGKETWNVKTYGKIVSITRQAIINDDLNGFARLSELFGQAAANLEADVVWGLIINNTVLADGKALFHADHSNLKGSGGAKPSLTTLSAGRLSFRKQTGLAGESLNLMPKFLIVPPELETVAEQIIATGYMPTTQDNINVLARSVTPIVESRLTDADAWYLACDPAQIDMIVHSYLDGQEGMFTETRYGFEVDGVQIKVRKDFGAGILDYRGMYKNIGK